MKVYLENLSNNPNIKLAESGFKGMGYECILFDNVRHLYLNKSTIVFGNVSTVRAALDRLNTPQPQLLNAHELLTEFLLRKVWTGKVSDAETVNYPVHIKPAQKHKLFNGFLANRQSHAMINLNDIADNEDVIFSEPINILSEYRVFILCGEIIDIKRYNGNCAVFPDIAFVNKAIAAFNHAPIAYSLDFAVTPYNTCLIEINDAFSLGGYGIDPLKYASMIQARWNEINQLVN